MSAYKLVTTAVLLALFAMSRGESRDVLDTSLKQFLEMIQPILKEGNTFLGLPSIDPLVWPLLRGQQKLESFDVGVEYTAKKLYLAGLSKYEVIDVHHYVHDDDVTAFNVALRFYKVDLKGALQTSVSLGNAIADLEPLSLAGHFQFSNLTFNATMGVTFETDVRAVFVQLDLSPKHIAVSPLPDMPWSPLKKKFMSGNVEWFVQQLLSLARLDMEEVVKNTINRKLDEFFNF